MPASMENLVVATRLKKVSFHSNPKEGETLYSQQKQDWELTGSDHELLIAIKKERKKVKSLSCV